MHTYRAPGKGNHRISGKTQKCQNPLIQSHIFVNGSQVFVTFQNSLEQRKIGKITKNLESFSCFAHLSKCGKKIRSVEYSSTVNLVNSYIVTIGSGVRREISQTLGLLSQSISCFCGNLSKNFTAQEIGQQGSETLVTCSLSSIHRKFLTSKDFISILRFR